MPYKSLAQEGLFHSPNSPVGPEKVAEFDSATKGMHLPKHVKHMKDGGVVSNHTGPNQKVSKDWGVDLTKWANQDGGGDMGKKGYEVDLTPAGQYDDAVRAEGNVDRKAQMEAKRQQMVNAQGMKDGGVVPSSWEKKRAAINYERDTAKNSKANSSNMAERENWTDAVGGRRNAQGDWVPDSIAEGTPDNPSKMASGGVVGGNMSGAVGGAMQPAVGGTMQPGAIAGTIQPAIGGRMQPGAVGGTIQPAIGGRMQPGAVSGTVQPAIGGAMQQGNTAGAVQNRWQQQNAGGAVGHFAKGGKVPGKGSGDHVAALLEPGELVIPKKDVEKMFTPKRTWDHDEDGE